MPPGNSSKKPAVVERCSYCRSPSCSGERNHITVRRFEEANAFRAVPQYPTEQQRLNELFESRGGLSNRTGAGSVSTLPAASTPAVSTSSQLTGSIAYVSINKTVGSSINTTSTGLNRPPPVPPISGSSRSSQTFGSAIQSSVITKPAVTPSSQLFIIRTNVGSSKTVESSNPSTTCAQRAVTFSSLSSISNTNVGLYRTAGISNLSNANTKPPAPKPPVLTINQSASSSCKHETDKTISSSLISDKEPLALKPAVSPGSQVMGANDVVSSSKSSDSTAANVIGTTSPAPKSLIFPTQSSKASGTVFVSGSIDGITAKTSYHTSFSRTLNKNNSDMNQDSDSSHKLSTCIVDSEILQGEGKCQNFTKNDLDLQDPLKKHSRKASIFEGAVSKFTGSRIAAVQIDYNPDGWWDPKLAQLLVEKFSLHRNAPACVASADIRSVLRVGDVIKLVCTEHRRKDSGFHYFAHQAWKIEDDSTSNNNWVNDAESVNSFASYGSLHDSEKQVGKATSRRQRRRKNAPNEQTSNALGVDIPQWLDNSSHLSDNLALSTTLIEGYEYFGRVVRLRLPFAFLVEVELGKGSQIIFVYSKYFYPDGPNSSSMTQGVSVKGLVSIGDGLMVIPIRSNQNKSTECEWVARKAWPKGKESIALEVNQNILEKFPRNFVEQCQSKNSDIVWVKCDLDGTILALQTDWGLVRDLKNEHVFVFTRKNSYLFGLSLRNFVLEDILQEGDLVKFSQEEGERGEMYANLLCYGCNLPDFNSFVSAIHDYCERRNIKLSIENELTMQGEVMYSVR